MMVTIMLWLWLWLWNTETQNNSSLAYCGADTDRHRVAREPDPRAKELWKRIGGPRDQRMSTVLNVGFHVWRRLAGEL